MLNRSKSTRKTHSKNINEVILVAYNDGDLDQILSQPPPPLARPPPSRRRNNNNKQYFNKKDKQPMLNIDDNQTNKSKRLFSRLSSFFFYFTRKSGTTTIPEETLKQNKTNIIQEEDNGRLSNTTATTDSLFNLSNRSILRNSLSETNTRLSHPRPGKITFGEQVETVLFKPEEDTTGKALIVSSGQESLERRGSGAKTKIVSTGNQELERRGSGGLAKPPPRHSIPKEEQQVEEVIKTQDGEEEIDDVTTKRNSFRNRLTYIGKADSAPSVFQLENEEEETVKELPPPRRSTLASVFRKNSYMAFVLGGKDKTTANLTPPPPIEFTVNMKRLDDILHSERTKPVFMNKLLPLRGNHLVKTRFCFAVETFEGTASEDERKNLASKITDMFLQSGSMFDIGLSENRKSYIVETGDINHLTEARLEILLELSENPSVLEIIEEIERTELRRSSSTNSLREDLEKIRMKESEEDEDRNISE